MIIKEPQNHICSLNFVVKLESYEILDFVLYQKYLSSKFIDYWS